jgi:hypothetical protein
MVLMKELIQCINITVVLGMDVLSVIIKILLIIRVKQLWKIFRNKQ